MLHEYGYDAASESDLNITSEGIEIDLRATHSFSGETAIVEAKAYTSNVRARVLTDFYGSLVLHRFDNRDAHGYLFVTPRLVPEGEEQARKAETGDSKFHYLNAVAIVEKLKQRELLKEPGLSDVLTSDPAIIITEEGIYGALKILDDHSRTANSVAIWSNQDRPVPHPVLTLVADSEYALGLEVSDLHPSPNSSHSVTASTEAAPIVVPIQSSTSDFDSFPAAPKNFVGRTAYIKPHLKVS